MGLGLIRKALFVMTAGLSGYVWKDNSKQQKRAPAQKQAKTPRAKQQPARARKQPSARKSKRATKNDTAKELERLAKLHGQGALSDAEFAAAKAKILATATPERTPKDPASYPAVEANVAAARHLADLAGRDRASIATISHD